MTHAQRWAYTKTLTYWPTTMSASGALVYGTPKILSCTYKAKSKTVDGRHEQSLTYYYEAGCDDTAIPSVGDFIAPGDHRGVAAPTDVGPMAARIAVLECTDADAFDYGLPDWVAST